MSLLSIKSDDGIPSMAGKLKLAVPERMAFKSGSRDYAFDAASKHTPQVLSPGYSSLAKLDHGQPQSVMV